jgi:glycosyltransferase involved in cell wall biosynthesis
MTPSLSVVVPCFNEGSIIDATAERLLRVLPGLAGEFEVVFCNDGSTDDTWERLKALAARDPRIRAEGYAANKGAGHAFRTALAAASGRVVVHMDADLAMDPVTAGRACIDGLESADLVFCSRYAGVRADYPLYRRLPSLAYRWLYRSLLGIPVNDAMSGFFGLRREVLGRIAPLRMDGFEVYLELLVKARQAGLRIREVPVEFVHQTGSGEFSVLADGPRQLMNTLRVWRRFVLHGDRPEELPP